MMHEDEEDMTYWVFLHVFDLPSNPSVTLDKIENSPKLLFICLAPKKDFHLFDGLVNWRIG